MASENIYMICSLHYNKIKNFDEKSSKFSTDYITDDNKFINRFCQLHLLKILKSLFQILHKRIQPSCKIIRLIWPQNLI